jgi:DNA-binding beta-propeller fold protein YncE
MNVGSSTVTVYKTGTNELIQQIINGVKRPSALAFDTSDNLYVANRGSNSVTVYSGNETTRTLSRTITDGVNYPQSLAFDSSGRLYVGNITTGYYAGNVAVYAPGKSDPMKDQEEHYAADRPDI